MQTDTDTDTDTDTHTRIDTDTDTDTRTLKHTHVQDDDTCKWHDMPKTQLFEVPQRELFQKYADLRAKSVAAIQDSCKSSPAASTHAAK